MLDIKIRAYIACKADGFCTDNASTTDASTARVEGSTNTCMTTKQYLA